MQRLLPALVLVVALAGCGDGGGPAAVGDDGCPKEAVVVERNLEVDNLVGGAGIGPGASQDFPLDLALAWPAAAPWTCVRAVVASISWTNDAAQSADLYVGLEVPAAGASAEGSDGQQLFIGGRHTETVSLAAPADPATLAHGLVLVVLSDWVGLSADRIDVQATITLEV